VSCVFCSIARGLAPAFIIYKSELVVAFLDKYPVSKGHTLVASVEHFEDLTSTPDDLLAEMIRVVKAVATAQVRGLGARGVRVVQNNGPEAGQEVFHIHFHVIPFYAEPCRGRRPLSPEEGESISATLRQALQLS